ncbi:MAG: hypothetical protein KAQ62_18265 [Cyclobacteriaceae bacterium]|nr:hypothetical protein [Cyclobacteriaceae bacterium]
MGPWPGLPSQSMHSSEKIPQPDMRLGIHEAELPRMEYLVATGSGSGYRPMACEPVLGGVPYLIRTKKTI